MNEKLWQFVDGTGMHWAKSYGLAPMVGRLFAWLMVCDPPEQTAAQLGDALEASKGSISGATGVLVRMRLIDRLRVRGERADRFRVRPEALDEQMADQGTGQVRALLAIGLEGLAGEPAARRVRLEELDAFYAWWQERAPLLLEEWRAHKRTRSESDG